VPPRKRPPGTHEASLFDPAVIEPASSQASRGDARDAGGAAPGPSAPLAERMRPTSLDDVLGQGHLLDPSSLLARAVEVDKLPSMILWGPPGCGKTSLARALAQRSKATFVAFSAVLGSVPELRALLAEAELRRARGGRTILFVDEIHRFNKAQQDAFLPHVERGTVTLVGATTENPSFSVVGPLLSRCRVFQLRPLDEAALVTLLARALSSAYEGRVEAEPEALSAIARSSDGDARRALGMLELVCDVAGREGGRVTTELLASAGVRRTLLHDKKGDGHYDLASALIKSMRGSDPDAAVYWMMRLLDAGDDPLFVLRRMLIFASEDVGNADPRALELTVAADAAFRRLGMPEGLYPMAQACVYLACAPKSNASNLAWHRARELIEATGALPVPLELRPGATKLARELGHGAGYRYPHDEPDGVARGAVYLPEKLAGRVLYEPTERGLEKAIGERLRRLREGAP
jgi:putative ATPase